MRFLADENVSNMAIERLRSEGHEVLSISETTPGVADPKVLETAAEDDLILITEDRDFGELVIRQRLSVRGVILLELDRLSTAGEAMRVETFVDENEEKLVGNFVVLEPSRTRIRPLPNKEND